MPLTKSVKLTIVWALMEEDSYTFLPRKLNICKEYELPDVFSKSKII
jgi:hypothetical protein